MYYNIFGLIPPSFLPVANKRLYEFQLSLLVNKEITISLPDDFILEERDTFVKIFDFYGYDCSDLDLIGECVKINSKEYSLNYYKTEYIGSRFMNPEKKEIAKKEIETFAFKRINDLSLDNLYKSLPSID